jgi:hypothetical protein
MRRASKVIFRALCTLILVAAEFSAPEAIGPILMVLVVVIATCWIVADDARSDRLARIIDAYRGRSTTEVSTGPVDRRRRSWNGIR